MQLIDECRQWWRLWSARLAVLVGAVVGYLVANPSDAASLFEAIKAAVPPEYRPLLGTLAGIIAAGAPIALRMMKQPALTKPAPTEEPPQ